MRLTNTGLSVSTGGAPSYGVHTTTFRADTRIDQPAGSAAAPTITFGGDTNSGMYQIANDQIGFSTLGTERMSITNTGVSIANALDVDGTTTLDGAVIFNNAGGNFDFRMEGDGDANLFVADASALTNVGAIGIGIAAPTSKLHVLGTVTATAFVGDGSGLSGLGDTDWTEASPGANDITQAGSGQVFVNVGTAALPTLTFDGDPNTGIYRPGAGDILGFSTAGTEKMRVDASGTLRIGDTAVVGAALLDVDGEAQADQFLSETGGSVALPTYSFESEAGHDTGMYSPAAGAVALTGNGNEGLRVDASGDVIIGGIAADGGALLDVDGEAQADQFLSETGGSVSLPAYSFESEFAHDTGMYSPAAGAVALTGNGNEGLRVDASGDVIIGGTAADGGALLDVEGEAQADRFLAGADGSAASPAFGFETEGGHDSGMFKPAPGEIAFSTEAVERMRIDLAGNVGIGTDNPVALFEVDGSAIFNEGGAAVDFRVEGDGDINTLIVDGSADSVGIGVAAPSSTLEISDTDRLLELTGETASSLTASTEFIDANFNLARTMTWATGGITNQRAIYMQAPTYAFDAASTITTAATLAISAAPTPGTNATITNNYALNVESGDVNIASGDLDVSGTVTATSFTGDGSGLTGLPGFVDDGNSFGEAADLGTLDANALNFITGTSGPNTRMSISAGGNITVNAAGSGTELAVTGETSSTSFQVPLSTSTDPRYSFQGKTDTGISVTGSTSDILHFITDAGDRMTVHNSGIDILASTGTELEVTGEVSADEFMGATGDSGLDNPSHVFVGKSDTGIGAYGTTTDIMFFTTDGVGRMTIHGGDGVVIEGSTIFNAEGNVLLGNATSDTISMTGTVQGTSTAMRFEGGAQAGDILFSMPDPASNITLTFPNTTDTLATLSDVAAAGGIANVVEDTTPQLGGNLDINGFDIVSTSSANIDIIPNGTGVLNVDSGAVFNDSGAAVDFRVEGDTDADLFTVDASEDRIGIGIAAPVAKLEVDGAIKPGAAVATCASGTVGMMQYNSTMCEMQVCSQVPGASATYGFVNMRTGIANHFRRAFVTSTTYTGDLGGVDGADAKCQARAEAEDLGGKWMALISNSNRNISTVLSNTENIELLDGTDVNRCGLWDASALLAAINLEEDGVTTAGAGADVWTGTSNVGAVTANTCTDFTSTSGTGSIGDVGTTATTWVDTTDLSCASSARLYCIEAIQ